MRTPYGITTKSTAKQARAKDHKAASESIVDSIHRELRNMAITFRLLPGERLNEATLAKELGVSRTPLREAQNRLMAEGFLTFSANQGFYRKPLDVKEIFDLYEFRQYMEMSAVRLAVERATDEQLADLEQFARNAEANSTRELDEVIHLDEEFHERVIALTGNIEMRNSLRNINERIHCVRWIDMNGDRSQVQTQHREIVRMLLERNAEESMRLMGEHIGHRLDQIVDKVERCYGRIYVAAAQETRQTKRRGMKPEVLQRISAQAISAGTEDQD